MTDKAGQDQNTGVVTAKTDKQKQQQASNTGRDTKPSRKPNHKTSQAANAKQDANDANKPNGKQPSQAGTHNKNNKHTTKPEKIQSTNQPPPPPVDPKQHDRNRR